MEGSFNWLFPLVAVCWEAGQADRTGGWSRAAHQMDRAGLAPLLRIILIIIIRNNMSVRARTIRVVAGVDKVTRSTLH